MASYKSYSDEELVTLLQKGERQAFDEIYDRFWDKLFVTATNRLGNADEAEDLVQDIMLRLWNNYETLFIQTSLSAYLAIAVKYEVINFLAKQKRYQSYASSSDLSEMDNSTEDFLQLKELQGRLAKLVKSLPEKGQMAFVLSREQGLSQKQIAEKMGISENTVETHLRRAVKRLRSGLKTILFSFFI
ncbi:RNA polymerase sigma factor [Pedobacter fastidiosus]|uniref:RNA polymerase sigma-70 factor n=1 Tax=Pedobacter fastidiosus TaxID=2765361 RepID=A0ABR7KNT4_9SPHI|nr:RNA polymerase sigma-70 factor [Pedobacter fastidiosus]MBC6109751.1 RNA polymerase sigma-70 factor [Pedobacter fastidiosus]